VVRLLVASLPAGHRQIGLAHLPHASRRRQAECSMADLKQSGSHCPDHLRFWWLSALLRPALPGSAVSSDTWSFLGFRQPGCHADPHAHYSTLRPLHWKGLNGRRGERLGPLALRPPVSRSLPLSSSLQSAIFSCLGYALVRYSLVPLCLCREHLMCRAVRITGFPREKKARAADQVHSDHPSTLCPHQPLAPRKRGLQAAPAAEWTLGMVNYFCGNFAANVLD